jgi:hypothetical protein
MRPSGRKAMRHGSLNVATVVMVKGELGSGFCSPILTWGQAVANPSVKNNADFAKFIFEILLFSSAKPICQS